MSHSNLISKLSNSLMLELNRNQIIFRIKYAKIPSEKNNWFMWFVGGGFFFEPSKTQKWNIAPNYTPSQFRHPLKNTYTNIQMRKTARKDICDFNDEIYIKRVPFFRTHIFISLSILSSFMYWIIVPEQNNILSHPFVCMPWCHPCHYNERCCCAWVLWCFLVPALIPFHPYNTKRWTFVSVVMITNKMRRCYMEYSTISNEKTIMLYSCSFH